MKKLLCLAAVVFCLVAVPAWAGSFQSYSPTLVSGTLIDFEGYGEGTRINTQYAGVTFGQDDPGSPMIDAYAWLYGYGSSSGSNVLTGSTDGGAPYPTVAGITVTFDAPVTSFQAFFSDTSPLGDYVVQAFGAGGSFLESLTLLAADILPPGYSGGIWPVPGTTPAPGIYFGFQREVADIYSILIGPSTVSGDAFCIDDVLYNSQPVPIPGAILLLGSGLAGLAALRRKLS